MSARKPSNRPKKISGKSITTRSGQQLKIHRSLGEHYTALREAKTRRKVDRMRGLPKSRFKRFVWRMQPKRLAAYWFSRDGGIMALKITGLVIVGLFVVSLAVFAYFRKDLPNITDISGSNLGGSISYYDRTGKTLLWQDYNGVKRVPVTSNNISPYVKEATVAIEDHSFYTEPGFDVKAVARAAYIDITHHGSLQGGSTITEQLVKLTQDFNQKRSLTLKAKELILAVELERTYTKEQILTGYLNAAPYGSVDYGVQAAASDYFHKSAKDLTLPEAAMLAAIPQSPAYYSPYDAATFDKSLFIGRYNAVLSAMTKYGYITKDQASAAKKYDILAEVQPQQTRYAGIQAPYFVLAAKNQLTTQFAAVTGSVSGKKVGGWKVITTVDMTLQTQAEKLVHDNQSNVNRYGADEEALVLEDVQTGQMQALVGGTDFNNAEHGQINYAQINISPGSSFKPYDYTTLIENNTNVGAGSVLYDSQGPLPGYPCTIKGLPPPKGTSNCLQDYDFRYPGPVTLRYGIGGSRNLPAVKAMLQSVPGDTSTQHTTSINKVISTANSMMSAPGAYKCYQNGVDVNNATKSDETQCYSASAIGDGAYVHLDQHVNGLSTLARLGQAIPTTYILQIYQGTATKPFYQWTQPKSTQVVRADSAYILDNMLSDPNATYLPAGYYKWQHYNGWNTAVKTGTTGNSFDGLMMGWNTKYAVGSWVGFHTRNRALTTSMEYMTTPLTKGLMTFALDNLHTTPVNWKEPSDIQHLPAFVITGHVGIGSVEPSPSTDIYPAWYKPHTGSTQNVTIDKVSGKLATNCTPDGAKDNQGGGSAPNNFSIDIFYPPGQTAANGGANTSASDDVHSCSDSAPSVDALYIEGNPNDLSQGGSASCSGSCSITITVSAGTHPFNDSNYPQFPGTVNLLVNGAVVQSQAVSSSPSTITFSYSGSGSVTIAAQVVDSVLFTTTSANATVNFVAAASKEVSFQSANLTTASWSGGTGPYTITRDDTSATICSAAAGATSCTYSSALAGPTNITITDTSDGHTDHIKAKP